MKRRGLMAIACTLISLALIGHEQAESGTVRPATIADPEIVSDILLVGSSKVRIRKGGRSVSHLEALAICRKRLGWSNVARVTIRKDGTLICHRPVVRR